jgi:integrase
VADVTSDDITVVMGALPAELSAKTRLEVYVLLRRLFDLAIFPAKLRKEGSSPVTRYVRPELDPEKLFCFIYPSELLAVLRGTNAKGEIVVPLGRRVLYAVATYTGQRKGSLYALQWGHVDFQHGTLASFRTKTRRAQYFVADPGLMDVLRLWHEFRDKPAADQPIVRDEDVAYDPRRLATALRDDLKAVGVTRAILFEEKEPTVEPLRFHDLRSTFCTWARRLGRSDMWISERTGHEVSGDMINRYDRGAQTLQDLDYEPFPSIAGALPELAALATALSTGHASASRTTQTAQAAPTDDVVPGPCDPSQVPVTVRDRGVGGSNPLAPTRHAGGVPWRGERRSVVSSRAGGSGLGGESFVWGRRAGEGRGRCGAGLETTRPGVAWTRCRGGWRRAELAWTRPDPEGWTRSPEASKRSDLVARLLPQSFARHGTAIIRRYVAERRLHLGEAHGGHADGIDAETHEDPRSVRIAGQLTAHADLSAVSVGRRHDALHHAQGARIE